MDTQGSVRNNHGFTLLSPRRKSRLAGSAAALFLGSTMIGAAAPSVTWQELSPPATPPARSLMAMTYDAVSQKVLMFGGLQASGYLNDTWTFDGTDWTQVSTPVAPPARTAAQMAYDRRTHQVVLFGGYNGVADLGDTWVWDGSTSSWAEATPQHAPKAVTGPVVFTDPNGHVDVYGGYDGFLYQLTMWQWNGSDWVQLHLPTVPFARAFTSAATDFYHNQVVIYGGLGDVNPVNTWTYDGTTWTEQSPALQPLVVYSTASAYDPNLHGMVLFGGADGGVDKDTTWGWTGSQWEQLFPTQSPSAREGAGMTYDKALDRVVLFGGQNGGTFFNDTWQLVH